MTDTQTNGSESPGELAVRHGIASYQSIVIERDELAKRLETAEKLIAVYKIEIEGYRAQTAAESNRTVSYQNERDNAVANLAIYQTLFTSFLAQMRAFEIENVPLVKDTNWSEAHQQLAKKIRDAATP